MTVNKKNFEKIRPIDISSEGYKEMTVEEFNKKFKNFFSNFPDDVIEQWPYRDFAAFLSSWEIIDYEKLKFSLVKLDNEQIMQIKVAGMNDDDLIKWGRFQMYETEASNYLKEYMKKEKKAPVPIIVLDTLNSNISGDYNFGKPYHLLEGHRRLSFLKTFISDGESKMYDKQTVWLAKIQ